MISRVCSLEIICTIMTNITCPVTRETDQHTKTEHYFGKNRVFFGIFCSSLWSSSRSTRKYSKRLFQLPQSPISTREIRNVFAEQYKSRRCQTKGVNSEVGRIAYRSGDEYTSCYPMFPSLTWNLTPLSLSLSLDCYCLSSSRGTQICWLQRRSSDLQMQ